MTTLLELNEKLKSMKDGECISFKDLSIDDYHSPDCEGLSPSRISYLAKSRKHLFQAMEDRIEGVSKSSDAFNLGSLTHLLLTEPEKFNQQVVVTPTFDKRTTIGKEAFKEFEFKKQEERKRGTYKIYAEAEAIEKARAIVKEANEHELFMTILRHKDTVIEESFFYKENGIILKARPDLYNLTLEMLVDIKTTRDASRKEFRRSIVNYRYHIQAAVMIDLVNQRYGKKLDMVFACLENEKPHGVCLYSLDEPCLDVGREVLKKNMLNATTPHEGYHTDIQSIGLPAYAFDIDSQT